MPGNTISVVYFARPSALSTEPILGMLFPIKVFIAYLLEPYTDSPSSVYLRCRCVAFLDVLLSTPASSPRCRLGLQLESKLVFIALQLPGISYPCTYHTSGRPDEEGRVLYSSGRG